MRREILGGTTPYPALSRFLFLREGSADVGKCEVGTLVQNPHALCSTRARGIANKRQSQRPLIIFSIHRLLASILLFIYSIVLNTVSHILYVEHHKFCHSSSIMINTTLRLGQQEPLPQQVLELPFTISLPTRVKDKWPPTDYDPPFRPCHG